MPVVVDPVCVSKHGDRLIERGGDRCATLLFPHATVVTPNLDEAALLRADEGTPPPELAQRLLAVRLHLGAGQGWPRRRDPVDLPDRRDPGADLRGGRDDNRHTHGTGCTLASALASSSPSVGRCRSDRLGQDLRYRGLEHGFSLGAGIGPTDHLWRLRT